MQLLPRFNFITNLYCHVENIAIYHPWSNKNYSRYFEAVLGAKVIHKNIEWYKIFRKSNFWSRKYEDAFTVDNIEEVFENLKSFKKDEVKNIKELFLYFMEDYKKIWLENINELKSLGKKITEMWKSEKDGFIEKAAFITHNLPRKVDVFLCWNPMEFKATPFGTSSIIIETNSHIPVEILLKVVPHEIGHLLDMSYGQDSFSMFEKRWGLEEGMLIHEAIISLFFPGSQWNEGEWNKNVRLLSSKLRPILKKSIATGEDYSGFLLHTFQVLDQEQWHSKGSMDSTVDPT